MEPGGATAEGMLTDRPFARPFWGLVGDFDTTTIADYYPEAGFTGMMGSISALMLWVYVFVMTVVMVNLLIAQVCTRLLRAAAGDAWGCSLGCIGLQAGAVGPPTACTGPPAGRVMWC